MSILLVSLVFLGQLSRFAGVGFWPAIELAANRSLQCAASTASRHILAFDANDGTDLQRHDSRLMFYGLTPRQAL